MRCFYCMPNGNKWNNISEKLMNKNEIIEIAKIFVGEGIKKIRITGGEPLVRKDAGEIIKGISDLGVELVLTTNGARVDEFADILTTSNIHTINISLDSLDRQKFHKITKTDNFQKVFKNIQLLSAKGLKVKVNMVVIKGVNDEEILDFVSLTKDNPFEVRFIEFMPFSGNKWDSKQVFPSADILNIITKKYNFYPIETDKHDTSKKYKVEGFTGTIGMIGTITQPFCEGCNRLRLTADGKMKNCLFSQGETDLLTAFRRGEDILPLIRQTVLGKYWERGGQFNKNVADMDGAKIENRAMIAIGG
jgi:cyclic pyranopterin phosphate synthase